MQLADNEEGTRNMGNQALVFSVSGAATSAWRAVPSLGLATVDGNIRSREGQLAVRDAVRSVEPRLFDELSEAMAERLGSPPHFGIIRGLPRSRATDLLVAFSAGLGLLVEPLNQSWSRVVRRLVPSRDVAFDGRLVNEYLHTDGSDWTQPNDYTCLFCVTPDQNGGGASRLLGVEALCDGAEDRGELDEVCQREVPWRLADELGGGVHWAPIITQEPLEIRWHRQTLRRSFEDGRVPRDSGTEALLDRFERSVERNRNVLELSLRSGDLLFLDNRRCLHARTPIADRHTSARDFLRTKILALGSTAPATARPTLSPYLPRHGGASADK